MRVCKNLVVFAILFLFGQGVVGIEEEPQRQRGGFQCPIDDIKNTQCMNGTVCWYPHPTDCSKYIHCEVNADGKTGRPTVKDCPAELEWNDNTKRCDWPKNSTCPNKELESSTTTTTKPHGIKRNKKRAGRWPRRG